MARTIHNLIATEAALDKLGARNISDDEAEQLPRNPHVTIANVRGERDRVQPPERRVLVGRTDGGRTLTLVIEETLDPESWLIIPVGIRRPPSVDFSVEPMSERLPTNAPDPEPGDFDAEFADIDPRNVQRSPGGPEARLSLGVTVHGDDADKLRQIAHTRGQRPSDVVADLLRSA